MRLQYRVQRTTTTFKYGIKQFCDGMLMNTYYKWLDEIDDEIDKLEDMGYRLCYTKDEVEEAKQTYLHMLENVLVEPDEEIGSE